MSSAALQNPPSSIPALNTSSLVPGSPSNRYNSGSHPSPTQESYHAQSQPSGVSPASSSRRPSRRPSGNSAAQLNNDGSYSGHNSPMSSRAALSPVPVTGASSEFQATSDRDRRRHNNSNNTMAAAVPPRTSSTQQGTTSGAGGSSSRRAHTNDQRGTGTTRRTQGTNASGNAEDESVPSQSSRSRRHHHAAQEPPERSSSNRDGRAAGPSNSLPIRPQQSPPVSPPSGPSREASEILNSILVSPPEIDIERERQRQALAQPVQGAVLEDDDAAPPPVVSTANHSEEPRQVARSRHDHSRREKQTRFGEYILGNTIGEGEFGKVKLGWKPGGVQVRILFPSTIACRMAA
jgi:protein-serine/threonine kinase